MLEIELQVVPPTPPRCTNAALMGNRSSAEIFCFSPCSCSQTGRKTTVLCLNARSCCTNELSTPATASNWPEKRCCFSTVLNCILGRRELSNIFTRNLSQSWEVKPTMQTARRLRHLRVVCSIRAS